MFALDRVTLTHGVSHMVPPSAEKFRIKSKDGIEYLKRKSELFLAAKRFNAVPKYYNFLADELQQISADLYEITDSKNPTLKMDKETDPGWVEYNQLMEKFTVCSYFLNRCKDAL